MEQEVNLVPPDEVDLERIVHTLYEGKPVNLNVVRPVSSVTVIPIISGNEEKPELDSLSYSECGSTEKEIQSEPAQDVNLADTINRRLKEKLNLVRSETQMTAVNENYDSSRQPMCNKNYSRKVRDFFAAKRFPFVTGLESQSNFELSENYADNFETSMEYEDQVDISQEASIEQLDHSPQSNSDPVKKVIEYSLVTCNNSEYAFIPSSSVKLKATTKLSEEDFDEMWQLPVDICRICAKRSKSIENLFSDASKELNIIDMIHNHLPIEITAEDLLSLNVCQSCIKSLQIADNLLKTCIATNHTFSVLAEHVCRVSIPAEMRKVTEISDQGNPNKPISDPEPKQATVYEDCNSQDKTVSTTQFFCKLLRVDNDDDTLNQLKHHGDLVTLIKLPKPTGKSEEPNRARIKEILKDLQAYQMLKKKEKRKVLDVSSASCKTAPGNAFSETHPLTATLASQGRCNVEIDNCKSSIGQVIANSDDKEQDSKLKKAIRQKERRRLARLKKTFKCCDCDNVFVAKEELAEHKMIHLKCKFCDKLLKNRISLVEHERVHTKEKPFICDQCGLRFRTKPQMMQHAQRHNPDTPYKCEICGQAFSVKTTYTSHVLRHNPESEFLCETCGKGFKCNDALRFHKLSHRTFKCPYCDLSLSYRKLQVHKKTHTGEGYFTCSQCDKKFLSRERLKNHEVIHEGIFPFNCGVCQRSFKRITHLQAHRERHAGDLLLGLLFYRCAVCQESFEEAGKLSKHVESHSDEERRKTKAFQCTSCGKCFSEGQQLVSHERQHDNPLFSCSICNQSFEQQEQINEHSSDHFEDKPLACNVCNKRFGSLLNLNSHKAIHSSVKPYLCEVCKKTFKTLNGLNQHKTAHSNIRKFTCLTCNDSFKRRDALKNHERTHFTERPYSCSVCARSFKAKTDCVTHVRRHRLSGIEGGSVIESLYNCPACPEAFAMKVDLTNHINGSHPSEAEALQECLHIDTSSQSSMDNSCAEVVIL